MCFLLYFSQTREAGEFPLEQPTTLIGFPLEEATPKCIFMFYDALIITY